MLAGVVAPVADARPISKPTWLPRVTITEYFPVPERWFVGRKVSAPGLSTRHRIDWLYGGRGLSMEGDGVGLDGRRYHISGLGRGGWVDKFGRPTGFGRTGSRALFWRAGGFWRNVDGRLTFPLSAGGWFNGPGARYVPLPGVRFSRGASKPLRYYRSIAVDPRLIPMRSCVFVPAYQRISGGWFTAADTGGAIDGRHIDVFRPAPSSVEDGGRYFRNERIFVIPPPCRANSRRDGD